MSKVSQSCLIYQNGFLKLIKPTLYENLLLRMNNGVFCMHTNNTKYIEEIFEYHNPFLRLRNVDEQIIRMYYGFENEDYSLREIGNILNKSPERIRQIGVKGLRMMKCSTAVNICLNQIYVKKDNEKPYKTIIINQLKEEIKQYKENNQHETVYLKAILNKLMELYTIDEINKIITIDELGLSIRTYNCLKRANYKTLDELLTLTYDDLISIRNMGKKSTREVFHIIEQYKTNPMLVMDEATSISINGYLFNSSKILGKINQLFEFDLSEELIQALLSLGYIEISKIMENKQIIDETLNESPSLQQEFRQLVTQCTDMTVYLDVNDYLVRFIKKHSISTIDDLKDHLNLMDDNTIKEQLNHFINYTKPQLPNSFTFEIDEIKHKQY